MSVVVVLTPHGRRQTVRCAPNQTCMHILEEVCRKHGEFAVADYELIHHRRVIDLAQMFRFAGLPNNAQLEMQPTTRPRSLDADVTLMLQLECGRRVQGTFAPDTNVDQVVRQLCEAAEADRPDVVCVYMRTEIWGERLRTVTLRSLGLTGGRAAMRLMHKSPDSLRVQANVSAPMSARPAPVPVHVPAPVEAKAKDVQMTVEPTVVEQAVPLVAAAENAAMDVDDEPTPAVKQSSPVERKKARIAGPADVKSVARPVEAPVVHVIGQHAAIAFSLDARSADAQFGANAMAAAFDDSFYDVSVADLKVMLRDLRCEARGNSDAPLLTAKQRELEDSQRTLQLLGRYKRTVIRVQFADRLVLQGQFSPVDSVQSVRDWVRSFLSDAEAEVELFTTPPKQVLAADLTLVEANCVPTALLHAATSARLAGRFAEQLSSPSAAVLDASNWLNRKSPDVGTPDDENASLEDRRGAAGGCSPDTTRHRMAQTGARFMTSGATEGAAGGAKKPKWFKPIGK